jgi:hypothetical protein
MGERKINKPIYTRLSSCTPAREEEWAECNADCGKYLAELDKEGQLGK